MNQRKMMVIFFLFGFVLGAISCSDKEFQCGTGACIDVTMQCDGYPDCLDTSDEIDGCGAKCVLNDLKQFRFKDEPVKAVYRSGNTIKISCPMELDYDYAHNYEKTSAELSCKNGSWVGNVPQCITTCQLDGFSQYLMNNQLTEKSYRHGQKIIIACPHSDDHEYDYDQLSEDLRSELTCHDGQWIGSYPKCYKGCFSKVLNDFLVEEQNIIDEYRSGEIISVSCFRKSSESQIGKNIWGYESDNQTRADMIRNLICLNGQWVGEYPECFALCRRSSIQGALTMETGSEYFLPGDVVQIKFCWGNIPVEGDSHLTCMANGSWYGNASCPPQIRTCQYPDEIENGQILNNSVEVGQHIHFRCDEGYILKGPNMMLCYNDGNFHSEIMPTCEAVQCQPLRHPDNGWIDHYEDSDGRASNNYGSFVRIRCRHGYQLIGSKRRQCQSDMTWSGEDAVCQRQRANCYKIPVVPGAKLEGQQKQWYIHGSNISYSCMQNYILRGSRHFSCDDGQWMGGGFNCTTVQCQPLRPPDNGWIDHYENSDGRASNNYGSFVRIRCRHGYQLIGSERRQCQSDMTWSGEDAVCQRQRANCYKIPVVPGAKLEGQQKQWYIHGSNISYSCMQNYILRGSRQFLCVDGQWMGGGFNCTSPVCKLSPLDLRYGRFSGVDPMTIVHGDSMSIRETIKCNDGYTVPPNISYVSCYNSTLDPPTFDCVKYDDSISSCHLSNYEGKVIRYKDKCYLATDSTFMYRHYGGIHKDAGSFCRNLGSNAYLAIIPDKETNEAVRYLINLVHGEHKYWFGAQWNSYKSRWMWHNEIPLNYTNWKSGDDSKTAHVKSQNCAVFTSDGRWEDTVCWNFGTTDKMYKALCEIAVNW
ncbi:hypothetical protein ACJMK2_040064 [Sinanodonta woodiana]|uniref:Uncharacterized protein n=1 Tax=Sinanodonta woodiana TaxID=1069815 RepID=A0ABD3WE14_SINWO